MNEIELRRCLREALERIDAMNRVLASMHDKFPDHQPFAVRRHILEASWDRYRLGLPIGMSNSFEREQREDGVLAARVAIDDDERAARAAREQEETR